MDSATTEMLRASLRHVLTETGGPPLAVRLSELGWDEVLADDRTAALLALFDIKGETRSAADALDAVIGTTLGAAPVANSVVVWPSSLHPGQLTSTMGDEVLEVSGIVLRSPGAGEAIIVPVTDNAGIRLAYASGDVAGATLTPIGGMDAELGLSAIRGRVAAVDVTWFEGDAELAWNDAVDLGRWLIAAELVGLARHILAGAVAYACDRYQYGRPIGSFQAVQHRLADAHAAISGASGAVTEAADSGSSWAALVAKALAGRAFEETTRQAQQAYGAIGFTWEHEFHRGLRRGYVLDAWLGDWRTLEAEIGSALRTQRRVPRLGDL